MWKNYGLSHTLTTSFFFLFLSNPSTLHLSLLLTDNPTTEQWWRQSGWPIARRHLQSTTFKNDFTEEQKTRPAEIPQNPHSEILESLLLLLFPSLIFYLQLFSTKHKKKKKKKTDRLILMRWLTTPDKYIGRTIFSLVGRSLMHASVNRS